MDNYCHIDNDNYNYDQIFEKILPSLSESDYIVANLETTVSGKEAKYTSSCGSFNTPEQFLLALKRAGISFVTTANNHILDRGLTGMFHTLEQLDTYGIRHTGTYRETEIDDNIIEIDSCRIAILSFTYGTNSELNHFFLNDSNDHLVDILRKQPTDFDFQTSPPQYRKIAFLKERVKRKLYAVLQKKYESQVYDTSSIQSVNNLENERYEERAMKKIIEAKKKADFVFVCLHSGGQYNSEVGEYTKYIISKFCDTKAVDAIVTNHPHCILPHYYIGNTLVLYALGNFTFTPDEWTRHNVLCEYNILFHVYIDTKEKNIRQFSFSLVKNANNEDNIMIPINVYDLPEITKNTHKEIIKALNRFGYSNPAKSIKKEYLIRNGRHN